MTNQITVYEISTMSYTMLLSLENDVNSVTTSVVCNVTRPLSFWQEYISSMYSCLQISIGVWGTRLDRLLLNWTSLISTVEVQT